MYGGQKSDWIDFLGPVTWRRKNRKGGGVSEETGHRRAHCTLASNVSQETTQRQTQEDPENQVYFYVH